MNIKIKSIVISSVVFVSVLGFTAVPAYADDGGSWGQGGNGGGNLWGNLWGILSGNSQSNAIPPIVTLSAGWNLVDENVMSALSNQGTQVSSDYWNGQSYQSTANSTADGIWVYLSSGATVSISPSSSLSKTVSIAQKSWGMIGNPYNTSVSVTLQQGDVAYTYDASAGNYSQGFTGAVTLQPGQGAWLYSASGGSYSIGMQPPSPPSGTVTGSVYGNAAS